MTYKKKKIILREARFAQIVVYLCKKRDNIVAGIDNLKPFEKGNPGGPGRPKGVPNSKTRLLRLLELVQVKTNPITGEKEEFTVAEQLDLVVLQKAFKGDLRAYQELMDRLEGRAKQSTEVEISGGMTINWEEKKTYVANTGSL
jgi:hypothetical protein